MGYGYTSTPPSASKLGSTTSTWGCGWAKQRMMRTGIPRKISQTPFRNPTTKFETKPCQGETQITIPKPIQKRWRGKTREAITETAKGTEKSPARIWMGSAITEIWRGSLTEVRRNSEMKMESTHKFKFRMGSLGFQLDFPFWWCWRRKRPRLITARTINLRSIR